MTYSYIVESEKAIANFSVNLLSSLICVYQIPVNQKLRFYQKFGTSLVLRSNQNKRMLKGQLLIQLCFLELV